MLTINEVFLSIQGESSHAGRPCVFVRLTACDLRCRWCDTPYAFHEGRKVELDDVVADVLGRDCDLVEITGGEPLLQPDVYPLMQRLVEAGRTVLVETGGHVRLDRVPAGVIRIMDVKCPGSGESAKHDWTNMDLLGPQDEVKFVIADRADYEYACDVIRRYQLETRCAAVLLSPVHGVTPLEPLARWILDDGLRARLQVQLHKYIWGPEVRGV